MNDRALDLLSEIVECTESIYRNESKESCTGNLIQFVSLIASPNRIFIIIIERMRHYRPSMMIIDTSERFVFFSTHTTSKWTNLTIRQKTYLCALSMAFYLFSSISLCLEFRSSQFSWAHTTSTRDTDRNTICSGDGKEAHAIKAKQNRTKNKLEAEPEPVLRRTSKWSHSCETFNYRYWTLRNAKFTFHYREWDLSTSAMSRTVIKYGKIANTQYTCVHYH